MDTYLELERYTTLAGAIGKAVWMAQELEEALAAYLVLRVQAHYGIGAEKGMALLRKAERQPMGILLRQLKEAGVVEVALADRLDAALEERNWVVHRLVRENRGIARNEKMFDATVRRIVALSDEASTLQKVVGAAVEEWVLQAGVNKDYVNAESARLLKEWGVL